MTKKVFSAIIHKNVVTVEVNNIVRGFGMMYENEGIENKQTLMDDNIGRKILDAAIAIIEKEGYENLTIRRVAKESGCSNSAIYVRFEDKDALAMAVAALHAKPFLLNMDENYAREDDPLKNLNRITRNALEKIYSMDLESAHMQMVYCGRQKLNENPFLKRVESYIKDAIDAGLIQSGNSRDIAFSIISSFCGFAFMVRANRDIDLETAQRMLETHNQITMLGIIGKKSHPQEDPLWGLLKENGVNVDKALERMKGNKGAYNSFLKEFIEDPDFEALQESLEAQNAKEAFEYAHGLKGMAGNLGLDNVHAKISVLVEILRQGSLDGASEAYEEVMEVCKTVAELL